MSVALLTARTIDSKSCVGRSVNHSPTIPVVGGVSAGSGVLLEPPPQAAMKNEASSATETTRKLASLFLVFMIFPTDSNWSFIVLNKPIYSTGSCSQLSPKGDIYISLGDAVSLSLDCIMMKQAVRALPFGPGQFHGL